VHFLRTHLVNRKIASVTAPDDPIVFGKAGCTSTEFVAAMTGKTVREAKQQGKYFWLEMSSPPHALMHFGMTGWIHFSNVHTGYYKPPKTEGERKWPPDYTKWRFVMEGSPECEVVFVDPRRLGRVRLVDVPAEKMRGVPPLSANGPDPVVDKEVVTKAWLGERLRKKRVPVKAWFLDQGNLSGVGNWVADELLFQARVHPEQYSNSFSEEEVGRLHDALMLVCQTACDTLAISDDFPENCS
jgi:formamidopyrimidine-DNA glycosylase